MKWYGPTQFALFRAILGIYLTIHFAQLIPVSTEIFSNEGVIKNASSLPSYGKIPNILFGYDDPYTVTLFLSLLVLGSMMFTFGIYRRMCSVWLYYGWMCLLNRNPLITNPSVGYIGWILLACSTIPPGERMGFLLSKEEREKEAKDESNVRRNATFSGIWEMPDIIYYGSIIIVGVSYTASGLHKLNCATWLDGTALYYVLTSPVARQNFIVDFILSDMIYVKIMSWSSLFLEISSLFLGTFYRSRKYYWFMYIGFHVGILATVNFVDLTFGMIMAHLFTFDPSWFNFTRRLVEEYDHNGTIIQEFDINHTDNFNLKPMSTNFKEGIVKASSKFSARVSSNIETTKHIVTNIKEGEPLKSLESSQDSHNILKWIVHSVLLVGLGIMFRSKGDVYSSLIRLTEITVDMYWAFGFLAGAMGFLMVLERIFPDQELKYVPGWWKWVLMINIFQLFAVVLAAFTWEDWLLHTSYFTSTTSFHLKDHFTPFLGGVISYGVHTWVFYWFHLARHEIYILWCMLHQLHHSASRIETITSFYKHPLEIVIDAQIMAVLMYAILGADKESSIILSIFAALGEYFYHMNIKTPWVLGYFFQRPEAHRVHHRRNKRLNCPNLSDLPLWDILGATFENPESMDEPTGFSPHLEVRRIDILFFKDVITGVYQDVSDYKKFKKVCIRYLWYALVIWGSLNSALFLMHYDGAREIAFVSASSPLPLVFSTFNGQETYSTGFNITVEYQNGTIIQSPLDANLYNKMGGAYNRRNIYGAVFTHGPFFDRDVLINIRQNILHYAVCAPGSLTKEFGFEGDVLQMCVDVFARSKQNQLVGELQISCDNV